MSGRLLFLVLLLSLSGCMTTSPPDGPSIIEQELSDLLATEAEAPQEIPSFVTDALIPEIGPEIAAYDPALEKFDISVKDLDVREFYQALVKETPFNAVVHPDLNGTISLELKAVTLDQVLSLVRELHGFEYKRSGSVYRVFPGGLRTEIFKVNYLNVRRSGGSQIQVSAGQVTSAGTRSQGNDSAESRRSSGDRGGEDQTASVVGSHITTTSDSDFWGQLNATLQVIIGRGDGRSVVTAPESGVVVVRALPTELRIVEEYLRRTEISMQRQVVLEAKILEVILDEGYSQGISWSGLAESSALDASGIPKKFLFSEQAGADVRNPGLEGMFAAALRLNDFEALIELLSTQGKVQVLSSPRIATVNNQKAVIKVGSDEFFVTEIRVDENNNVNSANTTNTDVELTPFFSGIALDVTPQISDDRRIVLHVHPSISEVSDQTKIVSLGDRDLTLPLALSTIRETDSVITAMSGQVVVIGGLISDTVQDDNAGVPRLSRLPLIGAAFSQRQRRSSKSELVILIRPVISTPDNMRSDLEATRDRFTMLESDW